MAGDFKERARKPEQRKARRDEILKAARAELLETPFQGLQMLEVAQRAGVAKGTLYLYFESKEALGLALLEKLLGAWFADIDDALGGGKRLTPRQIATLMCQRLEAHAPLRQLLALAQSVLEHNLTLGEARGWKGWLLERLTVTGANLDEHLRSSGAGSGARLLLHANALVVGLSGMAEPAAVVGQVLAETALRPLRVDFRAEFIDAVEALAGNLKKGRSAHG
jgi:TetR/AcrR family transcriptional regulator, cholesterol catabolism regulator